MKNKKLTKDIGDIVEMNKWIFYRVEEQQGDIFLHSIEMVRANDKSYKIFFDVTNDDLVVKFLGPHEEEYVYTKRFRGYDYEAINIPLIIQKVWKRIYKFLDVNENVEPILDLSSFVEAIIPEGAKEKGTE